MPGNDGVKERSRDAPAPELSSPSNESHERFALGTDLRQMTLAVGGRRRHDQSFEHAQE
jgi:hypothetical protein